MNTKQIYSVLVNINNDVVARLDAMVFYVYAHEVIPDSSDLKNLGDQLGKIDVPGSDTLVYFVGCYGRLLADQKIDGKIYSTETPGKVLFTFSIDMRCIF